MKKGLVVISILLGLLSFTACKGEGYHLGMRFELDDNNLTYVLASYTGKESYVTVPSTFRNRKVTGIAASAFNAASNVISVTLPDTINYIGNGAFSGCSRLREVEIPDGVKEIGDWAFHGCYSMKEVELPDSVKRVGERVFEDGNLQRITIGEKLEEIGDRAFACGTIEEFIVSEKNKTFSTFDGSLYTKDHQRFLQHATGSSGALKIADGTIEIAPCAAKGSKGLTDVSIPDSVVTIGDEAFSGCINLTDVSMSANVESIGESAFYGCSSLTEISLPDSLTVLRGKAFYDCDSLQTVSVPNSLRMLERGTFDGCDSLWNIAIPESIEQIVGGFSYCKSLTNITVHENNRRYRAIDGNLYSGDGTSLIQYAIGKGNSHFSIPNGVVTIETRAVEGAVNLTSIAFSDTVERIESEAFWECKNLAEVSLPDHVSIAVDAFGFTGIYQNEENWTDGVLYIDDYLIDVRYEEGREEVTLKDGVRSIADEAFRWAGNVTHVIIPKSISDIGYRAFAWCDSLTTIYYEGTEEEWNAVKKGTKWDPIYTSEGINVIFNYVEE